MKKIILISFLFFSATLFALENKINDDLTSKTLDEQCSADLSRLHYFEKKQFKSKRTQKNILKIKKRLKKCSQNNSNI
jgi:hypothetical protein